MLSLDRRTDWILNSLRAGVMVVDLTSRVVFLNRAGEGILGVEAESVLGAPLVGDPHWYPFVVLVNEHRKRDPSLAPAVREVTTEFQAGSGPARELGLTISNLVDEETTVVGYVVTFRDLTEINQLRLVARQSETLAALGRMAAGVAHEIRNPLHAIRASVELMQARLEAGRPAGDYPQIVFQEVGRLDRLIEDILAFSRPPRLERKPMDLSRVVRGALRRVPTDGVVLVEEVLTEGLPPALIDPDRITQVVVNLVLNAVQAQPGGGTVRVETEMSGAGLLAIRIRDEGMGIPDEHLGKLFEPFFTRRAGSMEGTGLGLPICQKLVEAHDGYIEVESKMGRGSCFSVFLPTEDPSAEGPAPPQAAEAEGEESAEKPRGPRSDLLLEDLMESQAQDEDP